MKDSNDFPLGIKARDRISGFEGIVTGIGTHITGCRRIGMRPVERADRGEEEWFFPEQLEVVTEDTEFSELGESATTDVDFELGDELEDEITGVSGIVGTITYNLFNCPRVALQPVDNTDSTEAPDREWFDAPRVSRVGNGVSAEFEEQVNKQATSATGPSNADVNRKSNRQ
jgi:hypothetical protein